MKKVFGLIMVCAFALAFIACGGDKAKAEAAAKAKLDSTRWADSVANVQAMEAAVAKAKADSTMAADMAKAKADSIAAATMKKKK
ncbi:hypothetical protein BH09BAC3_BH09BAC3_28030 [soil metagenome]